MNLPDALFLDIDGTILKSDHTLSDRMLKAIIAIKDAGTMVCLATGRSWKALKPIYEKIGLEGPTVCFNGAVIVEGPSGNHIFEVNLDEKVAREIITRARSKNMEITGFRNSHLVYEKKGTFMEEYHRRTKLHGNIVNFDDFETLDFNKAIIFAEHHNLVPVKAELETFFGPDRLSAMFSDQTFLELMAGGVNKETGLKKICHLYKINPALTAAIGDGWNDLAILKAAGFSWLMGGAPDELKALFPSHCIAPKSDMDGAAQVLEAMLNGQEPHFTKN